MSGRSEMKRKYPSGASERKKRKDDTKNTSRISTYFSDPNELPCTSQNNISQDAVENTSENSLDDDITKKLNDVNLKKDFPTDRGYFPGDISDAALRRTIIEHGPCRPKDPKYFSSRDEKKNFSLEYYSKIVDNVTIPRLWLCYSPSLQKPYCEVCWLFSDRNNRSNRDIHNMAYKISCHEKTKIHITAASIYGQWKSGKTMNKDAEVINKNNIYFWTKVLQQLLSVILTLCSLNLAFRGHRETSYDGVCEGGNFLAIVSLMAQYDDVLG